MLPVKAIWEVFWLRLHVPIGPILLAGFALWISWNISEMIAVRKAIAEYTLTAEIAARDATITANQRIMQAQLGQIQEQTRRAQIAESANQKFQQQLHAANTKEQDLQDEISELISKPVNDRCVVDGDLLKRLRNQ